MAEEGTQNQPVVDTDVDRYPNIYDVLRYLQDEADLPNETCDRLEVHTFANGEAVYKVWLARAEEPEAGHIPEV